MAEVQNLSRIEKRDALRQTAPYPHALAHMVGHISYKPGWTFWLEDLDRGQESTGLTFVIHIAAPDTNAPERTVRVVHYMPVPPAAYNVQSWQRWLFEQILLVEQHEAAEFFRVDGEQPYGPNHGPGYDPYTIREFTSPEERGINFRGEVQA